ncbi:MAG: hypothetical protein P8N75_13890 [Ascidiaceihabitans sp.]|nr:hypothetical protein [Ascidiaceihabitans sp.]
MNIAFLHIAQVRVETFEALVQEIAPQCNRTHHVAPELLASTQTDGLMSISAQTYEILEKLQTTVAVLCTCSTLGPLVDSFARFNPKVVRIDRPLMEAAVKSGPKILIGICLESTRDATLALLNDCAKEAEDPTSLEVIMCDAAWPYFAAGDMKAFSAEIDRAIRQSIDQENTPDCIVLTQASMGVANDVLTDLGIPIL